ncbi:MAG: protein kinase [Thiothrix litoralis]
MQIPNYAIKEIIGQGGMATVYRAEHVLLKQERAIKVMSPELSREPGFQESFIREGQIVAGLRHPHIITVHDVGVCEDGHFMVMEYLRGASLKERLKQQGALPVQEALSVLQQIGSALHYAHSQGLIHRDIKPANILFRESGEAVLTDFGISKQQDQQSDLTRHGYAMMGTPRYMSPEQTGGEVLDARSDLYSLALVFYEMLVGKPAIKADTTAMIIREHVLASPPVLPLPLVHLQPVLNNALAKLQAQRYANVQVFLEALAQQQLETDSTQIQLLPRSEPTMITTVEPALPPLDSSAHYGWRYTVLLLALLGGLGLAWVWWLKSSPPVPPLPEAIPEDVPVISAPASTPKEPVPVISAPAPDPQVLVTPEPKETQTEAVLMLAGKTPHINLYAKPDQQSTVLTIIAIDREVTVFGKVQDSNGVAWREAVFDDKQGFIKESHLKPK